MRDPMKPCQHLERAAELLRTVEELVDTKQLPYSDGRLLIELAQAHTALGNAQWAARGQGL